MKFALIMERPYSWAQTSTLWFHSEQEAREWLANYLSRNPNSKVGTENHEKITLLAEVAVLSDETF